MRERFVLATNGVLRLYVSAFVQRRGMSGDERPDREAEDCPLCLVSGHMGEQAHRAALSVRSPDTPRRQTNAAARDPASAPATASNHVDMASKQLDLSVCVCVQDYALKSKA